MAAISKMNSLFVNSIVGDKYADLSFLVSLNPLPDITLRLQNKFFER